MSQFQVVCEQVLRQISELVVRKLNERQLFQISKQVCWQLLEFDMPKSQFTQIGKVHESIFRNESNQVEGQAERLKLLHVFKVSSFDEFDGVSDPEIV